MAVPALGEETLGREQRRQDVDDKERRERRSRASMASGRRRGGWR
jgi:hypothetical protein